MIFCSQFNHVLCHLTFVILLLFLYFPKVHNTIDSSLFLSSMFFGCSAVGLAFFTCELGQQLTNALNKINDEFKQLNWYFYIIKIQRILLIILNNVQEPIVIQSLGVVCSSREQFKKV